MLGIAFDPPENKANVVKRKIEDKIADLRVDESHETQQLKKDELRETIVFLEDALKNLLSSDGKKLTPDFKTLASQKTASQKETLERAVNLVKGQTVTKQRVREYKKNYRLSEENIKRILESRQVKIVDVNPLKAFPKFPTHVEEIHANIEALRKTKDPNPNAPDVSRLDDLYAFAAYLCDDMKRVDSYRKKSRKDLLDIVAEASGKYSQRNDNLGKLIQGIATKAQSFVFNSDDNHEGYERYLKYCSGELTELFSLLKTAPEEDKLKPQIAEEKIKVIQKFFPEYETALAIYNKEAGFKVDFYTPSVWTYKITCAFCHAVNEFKSVDEARSKNVCQACQKPLFKKCVKCFESVPVSSDSCPTCGYNFVEGELFPEYVKNAEEALNEYDFEEADDFLLKARRAAPSKKAELEALARKIEAVKSKLREPIDELDRLIAERKYQGARRKLSAIRAQYPAINVEKYEKQIARELDAVFQEFSAANRLPSHQKVSACLTILARCADYQPALDFLRSTPPAPCPDVVVVPDHNACAMNVSWRPSPEQGVVYRLVRKQGETGAASENDGEILLDGSSETSYVDKTAAPGRSYSYSVFASRMNLFSIPVAGVSRLFPNVKNCRVNQSATSPNLRISWETPRNCVGATIYRASDGKTVLLANVPATSCSYDDADVEYDKTYVYKIIAQYGKPDRHSAGVVLPPYSPRKAVDDFSIKVDRVEGLVYRIVWDVARPDVDLRVLINNSPIASVKSGSRGVEVKLSESSRNVVEVEAASLGGWKRSRNKVEINTFVPCPIKKVRLKDGALADREKLEIEIETPTTTRIKGFYYVIRNDKSRNKWPTKEELERSGDFNRAPITPGQKIQTIEREINDPNASVFYISVFAIHDGGNKELIAEPQRKRMARPLKADLFWSAKRRLRGGLTVYVRLSCNRPIERSPKLRLCVSEMNRIITSYSAPNAVPIAEFESIELESPTKETDWKEEIDVNLPSKELKNRRLFLFHVKTDESEDDEIAVRWDRGFNGKATWF